MSSEHHHSPPRPSTTSAIRHRNHDKALCCLASNHTARRYNAEKTSPSAGPGARFSRPPPSGHTLSPGPLPDVAGGSISSAAGKQIHGRDGQTFFSGVGCHFRMVLLQSLLLLWLSGHEIAPPFHHHPRVPRRRCPEGRPRDARCTVPCGAGLDKRTVAVAWMMMESIITEGMRGTSCLIRSEYCESVELQRHGERQDKAP